MYEDICRLLVDNGARLIYTTNRSVGSALSVLKGRYPALHCEVSTNEKIAYELAFTASITAKKTACILSTEGLYEALDPVMSSAYTGVTGGFIVLCIQETEEEITPVGLFSKLPLIVAEGPAELARSIEFGYYLSEKYEIPVLIQATPAEGDLRSSESGYPLAGRRSSENNNSKLKTQNSKLVFSRFVKNPARWAATPKFRYSLHKLLNEKIEKIREEFECYEGNVKINHSGKTGVITDKRSYMEFYGEDTNLLYISTIYPLPTRLVNGFIEEMDEVYVIEGEYPSIELQIHDRTRVRAEHTEGAPKRTKPAETMHGFTVVRDTLGPASSINMAHGIKKTEPDRKILAITYENHFFHSGMPAFVNTIYNNSSYVLLIMTSEKEGEIKNIMEGYGFRNCFHIDSISGVERFKDSEHLTVLFCKGII